MSLYSILTIKFLSYIAVVYVLKADNLVRSFTETVVLFALRREERMKQVLTVTGDPIKELIVGVITDASKSCRTVGSVTTQFCRSA